MLAVVVVMAAAMAAAALGATGWTAQSGSWKATAAEGPDSAEAAADFNLIAIAEWAITDLPIETLYPAEVKP